MRLDTGFYVKGGARLGHFVERGRLGKAASPAVLLEIRSPCSISLRASLPLEVRCRLQREKTLYSEGICSLPNTLGQVITHRGPRPRPCPRPRPGPTCPLISPEGNRSLWTRVHIRVPCAQCSNQLFELPGHHALAGGSNHLCRCHGTGNGARRGRARGRASRPIAQVRAQEGHDPSVHSLLAEMNVSLFHFPFHIGITEFIAERRAVRAELCFEAPSARRHHDRYFSRPGQTSSHIARATTLSRHRDSGDREKGRQNGQDDEVRFLSHWVFSRANNSYLVFLVYAPVARLSSEDRDGPLSRASRPGPT